MNGFNPTFWFAVGGLSTIILIYVLLKVGDWIKRAKRIKEKENSFKTLSGLKGTLGEIIKKEKSKGWDGSNANVLIIMKNESEILCSICGQKFEKGSHWQIFGREYWFCFRCGLEGEIEKFIKAEYARAGYGNSNAT